MFSFTRSRLPGAGAGSRLKIPGACSTTHGAHAGKEYGPVTSGAEPPLFWAAPAPAPGGQGPGADSGSDLLGSALAPGKKRRLKAAPAPYTKIFNFELLKSELLIQVYFGPYLPF